MSKPLQKVFQFLYGPFFAVLDFFMRNYRANRLHLANLMRKKAVSSFFQTAAIVLLVVWVIIFFFASEESRNSLTEEVKQSFGEIKAFKAE